MKLIHLIAGIFNVIFYIVASPVLIPLEIWKYYQNHKWRKNIKVGDECFFINFFGAQQNGVIKEVDKENKTARFIACIYVQGAGFDTIDVRLDFSRLYIY